MMVKLNLVIRFLLDKNIAVSSTDKGLFVWKWQPLRVCLILMLENNVNNTACTWDAYSK